MKLCASLRNGKDCARLLLSNDAERSIASPKNRGGLDEARRLLNRLADVDPKCMPTVIADQWAIGDPEARRTIENSLDCLPEPEEGKVTHSPWRPVAARSAPVRKVALSDQRGVTSCRPRTTVDGCRAREDGEDVHRTAATRAALGRALQRGILIRSGGRFRVGRVEQLAIERQAWPRGGHCASGSGG